MSACELFSRLLWCEQQWEIVNISVISKPLPPPSINLLTKHQNAACLLNMSALPSVRTLSVHVVNFDKI